MIKELEQAAQELKPHELLEKTLSEPASPKGVYAALAEQEKRKNIKKIISVLKSEQYII